MAPQTGTTRRARNAGDRTLRPINWTRVLHPTDQADWQQAMDAQLYDAAAHIVDRDAVASLTACVARFPRMTITTALAIWLQRPDATLLADYATWQSLGYQVRRNEPKGTNPGIGTWVYEAADDTGPARYKWTRRLFDIAQTDARPNAVPLLAVPKATVDASTLASRAALNALRLVAAQISIGLEDEADVRVTEVRELACHLAAARLGLPIGKDAPPPANATELRCALKLTSRIEDAMDRDRSIRRDRDPNRLPEVPEATPQAPAAPSIPALIAETKITPAPAAPPVVMTPAPTAPTKPAAPEPEPTPPAAPVTRQPSPVIPDDDTEERIAADFENGLIGIGTMDARHLALARRLRDNAAA